MNKIKANSARSEQPVSADSTLIEKCNGVGCALVCYAIVAIVAFCVFVVNRGDPPYLFWDENYHVTSAERYVEGIAQFETHPPLGKMLVALGESMSGANKNVDKHILTLDKRIDGEALPKDFSFSGMRLMPSLFAALSALLFLGLIHELLGGWLVSLLFSGLYVFENAFVVHFRATHLDSFQMFFAVGAIWHFVHLWKKPAELKWWEYALLSIWCGLAIMVKVNGVFLLAIFPILYFKDIKITDETTLGKLIKEFCLKAGSVVVALTLVFFVVFYVHALNGQKMPDANSASGRKDIPFMSPEYREFLEKRRTLTPYVVYSIVRDNFHFMQVDNKGVPKLDNYKPGENGSHPLHWLFHDRNINYRWDSANGKTAYVQLVGNQLAWYCGTVAIILSLILVINCRIFAVEPRGNIQTYRIIEALTLLYLAFMALNLWMISQRVLYLYHYFMGLMISYVLLALMWKYLGEVHQWFNRHRLKILAIAVALFTLSYWFFLPLTNHYPMTKEQCELRNIWLSHIVDCQ